MYCPSLNAPQSYTPESPAVLRAALLNYDPEKQIKARLKAFRLMGHPTDKIELILMGGTFLDFPEEFQYDFVKRCYDALNNKRSKSLEQAKNFNETVDHRCVALCIETRPDVCDDDDIKKMLEFGATRVEIGVQAIDDKIYELVGRGHKVRDVVSATARLKRAGFKVGYHLMPGLPGSNVKKDLKMFKRIFSSSDFKPDQIKIYPCQVLRGSKLVKVYYDGKYKPYTKEEAIKLIIQMLRATPEYCRVMRVMREIPPYYLIAGILNIDLRKDVEAEVRDKKYKIKEIRFREVGFALRDGREIDNKVKIKKSVYNASRGKEIFFQDVNKDNVLFGLLRLRIEEKGWIFKAREECAMIRELHVYGPTLGLGERDSKKWQHKGFGRKLLKQAEDYAKKRGCKMIRIISGVGVRDYYRRLGYRLDGEGVYMIKDL